jgi:uncharacterized membrane protein SpoIIM required for sporulation
MLKFIDERKSNWQRLEDLLSLIEGNSLRNLSRAEVREFGELYRRAATDLAIARAETRDPKLINYLNSLVIRAHGKIYRAESQGFGLLWNFVAREFPQVFRRNARYFLLALGIFFFFGTSSYLLCYYSPEFANELGLDRYRTAALENRQWWSSLNDANQIGSSAILTNNIRVAFMAFALGALLGIGTVYVLAFNGLLIGGVVGVVYQASPAFGNALVTFMVGHGVVELSCIFIAGGAGMMIGYSLVNPGDLSRAQALKKKGMEAAKLVIGCAVLLFFAGIIEGFLSPSALPAWIKFGTGITTGIALYCYLLLAGEE